MARSILIIHPGALGDVLLAVPALMWIRAKFPEHRILLLSNEPVGRLLLECGLIDAWMSVQGSLCAALWSGSVPDSMEIRRWLGACDLAVGWMKDLDRGLAVALESYGIGDIRIQSPFSSQLQSRHHSDRFLETLGASRASLNADEPLQLPTPLVEQGRAALVRLGILPDRPLALIHPGSGSRHKCTNAEVLADVIVALNQQGLGTLILEGPADEAVAAQLLRVLPVKPTVLRNRDLSIVAAVMTRAQVYIGHDSGTTHLAARLGVPTLALFGPTNQEQWAPLGAHVVVIRGTPCGCRSWDEVHHCPDKSCLAISVGEILAAVWRIVGNGLKNTTPGNPSQYALSRHTPCAKFTS